MLESCFSRVTWREVPGPWIFLLLGTFLSGIGFCFSCTRILLDTFRGHAFFQIFASNAMDLVWFNRNLAAHGNVFLNPIELAIKVNMDAAVRDSLYGRDSSV